MTGIGLNLDSNLNYQSVVKVYLLKNLGSFGVEFKFF